MVPRFINQFSIVKTNSSYDCHKNATKNRNHGSIDIGIVSASVSNFLNHPSSLFSSPEPLGEPCARGAGPATRRPHPEEQEESGEGAHVRRGDIHRVLAAPADVPGALRHSSSGQQVRSLNFSPNKHVILLQSGPSIQIFSYFGWVESNL